MRNAIALVSVVLRAAPITVLALAGLLVLVAPITFAKDAPSYDRGVLLSMESTSCGYAQNSGKTVAGEIFGTDGGHVKTQEMLCQEYSLQTERIIYRIRPKDEKHPVLLPVGERVEFRIHKDKLFLRVPEGDDKERQYTVLSMQLREDIKTAQNTP